MSANDRPKGGRRPEDFPDARARDRKILEVLLEFGPSSRNEIAAYVVLESKPRLVTYALHRLRFGGLVTHIAKGHGYGGAWALTEKGARRAES